MASLMSHSTSDSTSVLCIHIGKGYATRSYPLTGERCQPLEIETYLNLGVGQV